MLNELLQPAVKAFIKEVQKKPIDYDRLLFNKKKYPNIPMELVVNQLKAREKAKNKLPNWFKTDGIIMPPLLSLEQSSSELTAKYKSELFTGKLAIDLTGGAGVDAYYLSKQFNRVIYVDINPKLAEAAKHNFLKLGATNIDVISEKSENFISHFKEKADLIYIDPARRDADQKLFLLEDCAPNIITLQALLLKKAKQVLIKASPMLDISLAINQLEKVHQVHIVAVKNEVKELLFALKNEKTQDLKVVTIDLATNTTFNSMWDTKVIVNYSAPLQFLYEPNAAIQKSGKADLLSTAFNLLKLNQHTHLFTSNKLMKEFPGRKFNVIHQLKYDKKEIKKHIKGGKANISVRNFVDSVEDIRKKTGIKPGGNTYLFGVRDIDNKPKILVCSKI